MSIESFLDYNQIIKVLFEITGEEVDYDIVCNTEDKHLGKSIIDNLKSISSLEETENPDVCRLSINNTIFINLNKKTGDIESVNKLTSFETRLLAQGKQDNVPFSREQLTDFLPKTDLHTHFAGAMRPETLLEVGKEHDIGYPVWALTKIGIDASKYEQYEDKWKGSMVKLGDIDELDIETLKNTLMLPPITQETFNKMEDIYTLRGPFTKNPELFPDFLRKLAEDYKRTGVEYAELSFSAFLDNPQYMQMLEDNLPQIEEETGVKLRFLAGFWRHSYPEWNFDDIDKLKTIAKSPYIVGCDFMGHETNKTLDFAKELRLLTEFATKEDPNFAIRVHAGENPIFQTNVYYALKIIHDEHERIEKELGKKMPMPQVRIGHGLYGLDIEEDDNWNPLEPGAVLKLAKEMDTIVEFNMSSNLALNNINSISDIPIKKYADVGIDVVLGTDGHGLYSTFGEQEVLLATAAGLEPKDFDRIRETEAKVLSKAKEREREHPRIQDVPGLYSEIKYSSEDGKKRWTDDVEREKREEEENKIKKIQEKLLKIGVITDEKEINDATSGKIPIMITGASEGQYKNGKISANDHKYIAIAMQVLANTLNPETSYIITGGTNFGVEKLMHQAVHRRNLEKENPLVLLGTLTMEASKDNETGIQPDTITHATVLEVDGKKAKKWHDIPDTQLVYTQERNGHVIAIGGGNIVSDTIQRAHNIGADLHLMDGPNGASTDKSSSLRGNGYSFKTIEELLQRLYVRNPNLFSKDFSLEKVESYIARAKEEIEVHLDEVMEDLKLNKNFGIEQVEKIDQSVDFQDRIKGKETLQRELQKAKEKTEGKEVSES